MEGSPESNDAEQDNAQEKKLSLHQQNLMRLRRILSGTFTKVKKENDKLKIKLASAQDADNNISELKKKIEDMERDIGELKAALKRAEVTRMILNSPRFNGALEVGTATKISKLQAVVRGFISRKRVQRIHVRKSLYNIGLLSALSGTVQGRNIMVHLWHYPTLEHI